MRFSSQRTILIASIIYGWIITPSAASAKRKQSWRAVGRSATARVDEPAQVGSGPAVVEVASGVNEALAPATQSLFTAGITAKADGTKFRASVVPALLGDYKYREMLSETKITLYTDTSTSLFRVSLSMTYNPFSLRGSRGKELPPKNCSSNEADLVEAEQAAHISKVEALGEVKTQIKSSAEKEALAAKTVTEESDAVAAAAEAAATAATASVAVTIAQSTGEPQAVPVQAAKEAAAAAEAAARRARAAVDVRRTTAANAKEAVNALRQAQSRASRLDEEIARLTKAISVEGPRQTKCTSEYLASQWPIVNNSGVPLVGVSVSVDTFPRGTETDPADALETRNLKGWGGIGGELLLSWRIREVANVDFYGTAKRARPTGAFDSHFANYYGGGLTVAGLYPLIRKKFRARSKDYVRDGFLPGLGGGVSTQHRYCDGKLECEKGRVHQTSATPFVDLRVKPALQFRVSLPISIYKSATEVPNEQRTEIVPTFSLAGQIAGL